MEQNIASYLFRNNSCMLPGIGELKIIRKPADTDFVNKQIIAPLQTIIFFPGQNKVPVFNELSAVSEHLKMILDTKKTVVLNGIGTFTKDDNGIIHFAAEQLNPVLIQPVPIERVVRYESKADIAGSANNKLSIQKELTETWDKPIVKKNRWWIAALVIGIISLAILFIDITQNGATSGNIITIKASDASATYHTIK
jgi:hypothetical protein